MNGLTTHRALAAVAVLLAVSAAFVGTPHRTTTASVDVASLAQQIEQEDDHVTAIELAQWIKDRKPGLRVLDIRPDSEFEAYHIPSAERVPLNGIAKLTPKGDETLVLYSEGGAHAAQGWVLLRSIGFSKVYVLRGGLLDWMEDVMSPTLPEAGVNAADDSARNSHAALSRYFGGVPRVGAVPLPSSPSPTVRLRRRGC
ncbi:MAG: rhodanese-like domain-containing protein [Gemmatimonadaceae bacterium]